jgi:hypothetical protein
LTLGEHFTIEGVYKRRTFWQWLRREAPVLQEFIVIDLL